MADLRNKTSLHPKNLIKIGVLVAAGSLAILVIFTLISFFASNKKSPVDMSKAEIIQLDGPKEGQKIAIITTNLGEMRVALYPENAPKTVENFITKANSGYYNGTYIFRNEPDVYFIGGSKKSDGTGGEALSLDNEISPKLWPFKGALCSISDELSKPKGGNNIMFVNSIEFTDDIKDALYKDSNGKSIEKSENGDNAKKLADSFVKNGGIPNFIGQYTVFGQTYEGLDVFERISQTKSDKKTKKPQQDIIIEEIEISEYTK